jgi:AbrB family looped-hinge helix DNA binding protein
MQVLTTITQKGQLTIPKKLRENYSLEEYDSVFLEEGTDHIKIKATKDILDLAGKIKPKKKKHILKAREEMEKKYKRV